MEYTQDELDECLRQIRTGKLSQRDAEKQYNIPRSTLKNKLKGAHSKSVGRPPVLTLEEEKLILKRVQLMCDYGFPATAKDVQHYIQAYLNTKNRVVPQFKNNLPGKEYMFYLLKRHKDYTKRLASNIKRARAAVDERTLREFHENLKKACEGVLASNVWNFDETALVNDPGRVQCIMKRGTRYPERVINHTKAGVSVMFCGNAEGRVLPRYCVYKSTRFNRSQSGWFDEGIFESFFNDLLLPELKKQEGKKIIIGDNLSSHLSESVIRKCERYDIKFICLPANSTHLCQPLDVAYFKPLKVAWRKILSDFRKTKIGQKETSLPKDIFPRLLVKLIDALREGNGAGNLIAGFRKCGIYPLNVNQLLACLPTTTQDETDDAAAADSSLVTILTEMRADGPTRKRKSKKVNVTAGKSISTDDFCHEEEEAASTAGPSWKRKKAGYSKRKKAGTSSKEDVAISIIDVSNEEVAPSVEEDIDRDIHIAIAAGDIDIDNDEEVGNEGNSMDNDSVRKASARIQPGSYVQVVSGPFKGFYASVVCNSYGDEWEINFFEKKFGSWVLKEGDIDSREESDLELVMAKVDKRGRFTFEKW